MGSTDALKLSYWERAPPLAAIAAGRLAGIELHATVDPKLTKDSALVLSLTNRETLEGLTPILRYVARIGTATVPLYGLDPLSAVHIDQVLDFAPQLVSGAGLEGACGAVNTYLALRTFMVGYSLSLADLAVWGQLKGNMQWDKLHKSRKYAHLSRWYDHMGAMPVLKAVDDELLGARRRKTAAEFQKDLTAAGRGGGDTGSFDIDLPGAAEGKVVTRFPPEPSGYLHIGHAKAALLNQQIADMYKGKMLVRFDDTNPSKEKDEYVENIIADIASLGLRYEKLTYTSDYFPQMLDLAERLIKAGNLYADDTPVDQMREERMHGIESQRRNRSAEENLSIWKEMVAGSEVGRANCLRFKLDMSAPNKALRDPVAYRCNETPHWRTGTKYKVYPTYDCACPFVDALEGVTHALRTSEYKDREEQYYRILRLQQAVWSGLPWVHLWDFARLSFVNTVLSKRKLTWFVAEKKVEGWNDPRFPTVQGMFRRGLQLEALREFILAQGASKNVTLQEWDKFWTTNKKVIDPVCPRHTAVKAAGRVLLTLTNCPDTPEVVTVPRHKKYPPAGVKVTTRTKEVWLEQEDAAAVSEGEEVTLMDWGNAIIRKIVKAGSGEVSALEGELHLEGSVKATKLKLTWLPNIEELVPLTVVDFGHLLTKKKLEEDDVFENFVNENSRWETEALGDANMRNLQKGEVIQLERKGYYICDAPLLRPPRPLVLLSIPDGRAKASEAPPKPPTLAK